MHLDRALVSSLLFVSAVLAQDSTWAGAKFVANGPWRPGRKVTYAEGTFTVPISRGEIGSGFAIGLSLDDLTCQAALAAGIAVSTSDNGVDIQPFGQFWPVMDKTHPEPQSFIISPGNQLNITVSAGTVYKPGYVFSIENISTKKSWSAEFDSTDPDHQLCKEKAYWVVSKLSDGWPLAPFDPVTFTGLVVRHGSDPRREKPKSIAIINIVQNGQDMTSVETQSSNVIVKYKSSGS